MIQAIFEELSCSQGVAVCHPFDLELVRIFHKGLTDFDVENIPVKLQNDAYNS